ncbi:FAD-binding domain-containing protein [Pterulicium gracile]|uniref:FAD-binding domain-containing protein n=1 Tax=Pterulicium gracile TaxID=1884261 RepID=A0A5C3QGH1_9AGAR|nr:FAD-binding domain-containing protein [Pterula gracilis]
MPNPCALSSASFLHDLGKSPCVGLPAANYTAVCEQIASGLTSPESVVYWPGSEEYTLAVTHFAASNSEAAACSIAPASPEDVGEILRVVASTSTPFAVKGGGHNTTPGSSSTKGVHIAMQRFSDITYHGEEQLADVGAGLDWGEVYTDLQQYNVTVAGGRDYGVGVGGLSLIGGWSWLTQAHGLTVDNIVGYQLVLPNGDLTEVTEEDQPDLFFALKGGGNNFGIVTRFTMRTYPQGPMWGGQLAYSGAQLELFIDAMLDFQQQTDPKAAVLSGYRIQSSGQAAMLAVVYYNAPNPPPGIFDKFLAIPTIVNSVVAGRTLSSFIQTYAPPKRTGKRIFAEGTHALGYTANMMRQIYLDTEATAKKIAPFSGVNVDATFFPLLGDAFKSNDFETAWPPNRDLVLLPSYVQAQFDDAAHDQVIRDELVRLRAKWRELAIAEGQYPASTDQRYEYTASAGPNTTLEEIYGPNVARLREIKHDVDPDNVMGLAGGFKF